MRILAAALLLSVSAVAQMELPPGTASSVPHEQASPAPGPAALGPAEDAIADGRYADAVTLLTPMANPAQTDERVFYDLGFAQDALNQDTQAKTAYIRAIAMKPADAAARVSLGLLYARTNDTASAGEQLAAATKIEGADHALLGRAWRALAEIDLKTDPGKARGDMLSALHYAPETADDAATIAQIAEAMQDDTATEQAYAHAFQRDPSSIDVATGYARALAKQKKFTTAAQVLATALQQHPANHALLAEQASEQLLQGHVAEALPTLASLHASEPDNAAVALLLARAYGASGAPEKAQPIYAGLLSSSPDDVTLMTEVADNLIRLKRSPEAEPLLQKALAHPDRFPSRTAMADAAGELAFAASSDKDAETVLKALAIREEILPAAAPFTFLSATAHDILHHTKQAADAYRLFLQQSDGKFPDQEWQAKQRLQVLSRAK